MKEVNKQKQIWNDPEVQSAYEEWLDYDPSCINIGRYEILFRKQYDYDPTLNELCEDRAIQFLNNGAVCTDERLHYSLVYNPETKSIVGCNFTMPTEHAWLGDVFATLPYGIIKKNKTGIGATTLELNSKRNSIIVVPTRALAYEKAKNSKIQDTNKYKILYCGGRIEGFSAPSLNEYLNDNDIEYKKLLVVADSLPRVLNEIGEDNYKNFFLMVDEIDSYQYDSNFRPNLENVVDYYFKFPQTQRCMISATMGSFSNPLIAEEPVIDVKFTEVISRDITLQPSSNPIVTALYKIQQIRKDFPNDKILIAFNLVTRGILPIIESLPDELKAECSVLCGDKSKPHVKEYLHEVLDNVLPSKITFMSATYFVGVDFSERYHLVTIMDITYPWTLLSTDKLQQIAGRCRHKDGLLSETIIYNVFEKSAVSIDYKELKNDILNDAKVLIDLSKNLVKAKSIFPKLIKSYNEIYVNDIINASTRSYHCSSLVKLVREFNNQINISYFNIDNILIQVKLLHSTYSSISFLKDELTSEGNNVYLLPFKEEKEDLSDEITNKIAVDKSETDEELRESIILELRERQTLNDREALAQARRNNVTNAVGIFLEHFIELQQFVPFESLVTLLPEYDNPRQYKHFYNAVIFWALDNEHPVKKALMSSFVVGEKYTGAQIEDKVNAIWSGALGLKNLKHKTAMLYAQEYFAVLNETRARVNGGKPQRVYEVISLNPKNLPDEHIETISSNVNIQRKIKM